MAKSKQTLINERVRQLANLAMRMEGDCDFMCNPDGTREIAYYEVEYFTYDDVHMHSRIRNSFSMKYVPNRFDYFADVIYVDDRPVQVSIRTYNALIRKLSEWEVMRKLEL